jgi:predicted nucleotide-binding protein
VSKIVAYNFYKYSLAPPASIIHEAGLFQGHLGFQKAIILLEDGCKEFSNIFGLGQIRFPKGNISAVFEDIRRVLEREKIL